jgi:RNA polymerase sigma factor (sigma-70 family)
MIEASIAGRGDGTPTDDGAEPSDDDLLARISNEADEPSRRAAWGAFYGRHAEYLFGTCTRSYRGKLDEGAVADLVEDTFLRVYERAAASYRPADAGDADFRRCRVRAWLAQIAERLAQDIFRGRRRRPAAQLGQEEWQDIPEGAECAHSAATEQLCRVMDEALDERERDVLRVTFHWHDPERDHQKLPEEAVEELARRWNLKPDNIRQIRRRALQKLKAALPPVATPNANGR